MATTFNTTNVIKQVKLPGSETVYEVADAAARSTITNIEGDIVTIGEQISALASGGLTYMIVDALPSGDDIKQNVIYLLPSIEATGTYIEYLAIKDEDETVSLERIGTTKADLADYEKKIESIKVPSYQASGTTNIGKTSFTPAKSNGQAATVTSNGTVGQAAVWNASVSNGLLEFSWTTNVPTSLATFGQVDVATVDEAIDNIATISAAASVVTGIETGEDVNATINRN